MVDRGNARETRHETIFDYLRRELRRLRRGDDDLPFDLNGGYVGYFGYELKADCGGDAAHRSPLPDAAFVFADRLIVFDHRERHTYVLCLRARRRTRASAGSARHAGGSVPCRRSPTQPLPIRRAPVEFRLSRSYETYLDDIRRMPGPPARRRDVRGLPDQPRQHRAAAGSARALPDAAAHQPGTVLGVPAVRRRTRC